MNTPKLGIVHAAGFGYQPYPPTPSEANQLGNLARTVVADVAEEVIAALDNWREFAGEAGVSEGDSQQLSHLFLSISAIPAENPPPIQ